jgi:hypothetical protein
MFRHPFVFAALTLCAAMPAAAQDAGLSVSAGVRAWYTSWTTFTYFVDGNGVSRLGQSSADDRLVVMPTLSLRWSDWSLSFSGLPSATYDFPESNATGARQEFDLTAGWRLLPGLNLTLGYKRVLQREGNVRYEPKGPVLGLSGTATLDGPWALYGTVSLGRLKTSGAQSATNVAFEADYRIAEVGLGYTLPASHWGVRRWTFTGGYRLQVMGSREAAGAQSGRDETNGLTLGVIAGF